MSLKLGSNKTKIKQKNFFSEIFQAFLKNAIGWNIWILKQNYRSSFMTIFWANIILSLENSSIDLKFRIQVP